jgi:hypothetical protein
MPVSRTAGEAGAVYTGRARLAVAVLWGDYIVVVVDLIRFAVRAPSPAKATQSPAVTNQGIQTGFGCALTHARILFIVPGTRSTSLCRSSKVNKHGIQFAESNLESSRAGVALPPRSWLPATSPRGGPALERPLLPMCRAISLPMCVLHAGAFVLGFGGHAWTQTVISF